MRSYPRTALTAVLCASFAAGISPSASSRGISADLPAASPVNARFIAPCSFSHRANDDPIVHPRMPGMSHTHDFLGNRSTDAFSTAETLLAAGTTCRRQGDRSAYWVPTLFVDDKPLQIDHANFYYVATVRDRERIQPYPLGLRVVAGDAHATTKQDPKVATWECETPACVGSPLITRLRFPDCWDGAHLDAPDHHSHMAYSEQGVCRPSHPVPVPQLQMSVYYPSPGLGKVTLASGSLDTIHGDFFNAWEPATLEDLTARCLRAGRRCVGE